MSLIHYEDLEGSAAAFNSDSFIRIRKAFGDSEPTDAITIRTDNQKFHSGSDLGEIVSQLQAATPLVELTTPVGLKAWISKDRLIDVVQSSPVLHHQNAKAVLTLLVSNGPSIIQQVQETVAEVVAAFDAA